MIPNGKEITSAILLHLYFLATTNKSVHSFSTSYLSSSLFQQQQKNYRYLTKYHETRLSSNVDNNIDYGVGVVDVVDNDYSYFLNNMNENENENGEEISLTPLSREPLLLTSSKPLLNRDECEILIRYLELMGESEKEGKRQSAFTINSLPFSLHEENYSNNEEFPSYYNNNYQNNEENIHQIMYEGYRILLRVTTKINELIHCENDPDEIILPRVLQPQNNNKIIGEQVENGNDFLHFFNDHDTILPDHLHVDNVNNKKYRHISCVLYLTENNNSDDDGSTGGVEMIGGSTTFPLATPITTNNDMMVENDMHNDWDNRVEMAARNLISAGIHHTQVPIGKREGVFIDQAAVELFQRENKLIPTSSSSSSKRGIRVCPSPGKLSVFHNLLNDGTPDPLVFHGAEALFGIQRSSVTTERAATSSYVTKKRVALAFFKEIPVDQDQEDQFPRLVEESREWLIKKYYDL